MFEFELKTKAIFGVGEFENLGKYVHDLGFSNIHIIIDNNVYNTSYAKPVVDSLHGEITSYNSGEPTYQLLEKSRQIIKPDTDCVVAIGGGSVIDFAKGLAFLATNEGAALLYRGFPTNINNPLPVIAIPTTAGTGSEVTYNAVFIDTEAKKKLGINTKLNFPKLAILDPNLLKSCPKSVLVSSGMDALVHSVESYCTGQSNALTKTLSTKAYELITTGLSDINYVNLQLGAYLAGIVLMNSGGGPTGALSYILGTQFNVPHGLAGAVFLPHIVNFNQRHGYWYDDLYETRTVDNTVKELCKKFDIDYTSLKQFGVNKSNVDVLLNECESLQGAFDQNPVPFNVEDAKNIIKDMI